MSWWAAEITEKYSKSQKPSGDGGQGMMLVSVLLRWMQRDDKLAAKRRMVLDSHFLEHLARDTDVAQVHSAGRLRQGEWETERQGPLRFHRLALSATWRIQTEHRRPVLVGPVCSGLVPRLIHQECVLMAIEAVDDEVHRGVREVCGDGEKQLVRWSVSCTNSKT